MTHGPAMSSSFCESPHKCGPMRTGVMRFLDADSFDIRLELLRTKGTVGAEACGFYCRLSLCESVRVLTLLRSKRRQLWTSEGLAQPQKLRMWYAQSSSRSCRRRPSVLGRLRSLQPCWPKTKHRPPRHRLFQVDSLGLFS